MRTFLRAASLILFKMTQFGLVVLGGMKLAEWADWPLRVGCQGGFLVGFCGLLIPHYFHRQYVNSNARRTTTPPT